MNPWNIWGHPDFIFPWQPRVAPAALRKLPELGHFPNTVISHPILSAESGCVYLEGRMFEFRPRLGHVVGRQWEPVERALGSAVTRPESGSSFATFYWVGQSIIAFSIKGLPSIYTETHMHAHAYVHMCTHQCSDFLANPLVVCQQL